MFPFFYVRFFKTIGYVFLIYCHFYFGMSLHYIHHEQNKSYTRPSKATNIFLKKRKKKD
uniref:Uncharacterized protein n=1 Tax=Anguilla anguilla TaxID=7936 RepID=A0A0E9X4G4_ANGAN